MYTERQAYVYLGAQNIFSARFGFQESVALWPIRQRASTRGYGHESFETALALVDDWLEGEIERMHADPSYESFSYRRHAYRHSGYYAEQLDAPLSSSCGAGPHGRE